MVQLFVNLKKSCVAVLFMQVFHLATQTPARMTGRARPRPVAAIVSK